MRDTIGWQEIGEDGLKYRIRVSPSRNPRAGGALFWRRLHRRADGWQPFNPTPAHWALLLEKVKARYTRREVPYEAIGHVIALARAADVKLDAGPPR